MTSQKFQPVACLEGNRTKKNGGQYGPKSSDQSPIAKELTSSTLIETVKGAWSYLDES